MMHDIVSSSGLIKTGQRRNGSQLTGPTGSDWILFKPHVYTTILRSGHVHHTWLGLA